MAKRLAFALLALLAACSPRQWAVADTAAFATAAAATACDAGGTYRASANGWRGMSEANAMLGAAPEPGSVTLYFATALTAELVAYELLPRQHGVAALAAVAVMEGYYALGNVETVGACGR